MDGWMNDDFGIVTDSCFVEPGQLRWVLSSSSELHKWLG